MSTGLASLLSQRPARRRVFFSFHYQEDIWRVNQVRNSWRFLHEHEREAEGFFDGSLWERSRRQGADSLKALIREGMKNTSVTCVLAGTYTYARRWVRYEIARSLIKGNGLLTVKIHHMEDANGRTSLEGLDPLAYMGVYSAGLRGILIAEKDVTGQWVTYQDYTRPVVDFPRYWRRPSTNVVVPLSSYAYTYDHVLNRGGDNFASWVRKAAQEADR